MDCVHLNGRPVGPGQPPYVIAEIGSNHNGDTDLALRLIDAAVDCGVDAVKFQSWSKSSLICAAEYARSTRYAPDGAEEGGLAQEVERYQLTPEQHNNVAAHCRERGVTFLSSVFSPCEVELVDRLGAPAFKVASMDVNNLPLLALIARRQKPVLLSTGMATLGEIERAIAVLSSCSIACRPTRRRPRTHICATSRRWRAPSTCRSASAITHSAPPCPSPPSRSAPA
jgi:N,N'-diacetyllegionaminate synthase